MTAAEQIQYLREFLNTWENAAEHEIDGLCATYNAFLEREQLPLLSADDVLYSLLPE